ncbi:hypothetical protein [Deinococcus ficus]|uniref:Uncharacterized protein n=1 Tax=Deinococcus ficus TaxID=317577 RepID=A0A221T2N0_9DEIO|nr:hypothetical protein [Deinococcus ficus]ASN83158.1 hypothetical protein DFI_18330 [Deinococcus ficus]
MSRKKPPGYAKSHSPTARLGHRDPAEHFALHPTVLMHGDVTLREGPFDTIMLELSCLVDAAGSSGPLAAVQDGRVILTVHAPPDDHRIVKPGPDLNRAHSDYVVARCASMHALASSIAAYQDAVREADAEQVSASTGVLLFQQDQARTYAFDGPVKACLSELLNAAEHAGPDLHAAELWGPGGVLCAWSRSAGLVWQPVIAQARAAVLEEVLLAAEDDLKDHRFQWTDYTREPVARGVTLGYVPGQALWVPFVPVR